MNRPGFDRRLWLALLGGVLVFFPTLLRAELDLSPKIETYELEGFPLSQLAFSTGTSKEATYQPPRDWKCTGGKDYLDLQPDGLAQARARISKWPAEQGVSFDPEGLKQVKERILTSLPEGSEQVKVMAEETNPLQIDRKQTYLVELSYTYYGEKFASYCLVLERKPEAICFKLSCRESDYPALRQAFHRSLFTWQNL